MHEELVAVVEQLRARDYPQLDAQLVAAILEEEHDRLDDRAGVLDRLERLIDALLHGGTST